MPDQKKIRVAIIGATAYTSREAIRWLLRHPNAEIVALCSRRDWMWRPHIHEVFPEFVGRLELPIEEIEPAALAGRVDVVMLCVPHAVATKYVPPLLQAGFRVIDFSAEGSEGYGVQLYANTPEQVVLCYRTTFAPSSL